MQIDTAAAIDLSKEKKQNESSFSDQMKAYIKHPGSGVLALLTLLGAVLTFALLFFLIGYILVKGGAARRGVRAGNRQVTPYRTDAGNQRRHLEKSGARRGKCRPDQEGATPQHVDERGRQHPPHQQMERRELHRPAESRLCGG